MSPSELLSGPAWVLDIGGAHKKVPGPYTFSRVTGRAQECFAKEVALDLKPEWWERPTSMISQRGTGTERCPQSSPAGFKPQAQLTLGD